MIFLFRAQNRYGCLACDAVVLEVFLRSLGKSSCTSVEADVNPTSAPDCNVSKFSYEIQPPASEQPTTIIVVPIANLQALSKMIKMCFVSRKPEIQVKMWKM